MYEESLDQCNFLMNDSMTAGQEFTPEVFILPLHNEDTVTAVAFDFVVQFFETRKASWDYLAECICSLVGLPLC